jgi:hypothetical protein
MAQVADVKLTVGAAAKSAQRRLRVAYSLTFDEWEADAWFREAVRIFGRGDEGVVLLATLTGPAFKASSLGDIKGKPVAREAPAIDLDRATLDVRPDVAVLADDVVLGVLSRPDTIAAEVRIEALAAATGSGWSKPQDHDFGVAAG